MTLKDKVLNNKKLIREVYDKYDCTDPYLFGSVARGEDTEASDIDLLFTPTSRTGLLSLIRIENELTDFFKREVELVNSKTVFDLFKPYIDADKIEL